MTPARLMATPFEGERRRSRRAGGGGRGDGRNHGGGGESGEAGNRGAVDRVGLCLGIDRDHAERDRRAAPMVTECATGRVWKESGRHRRRIALPGTARAVCARWRFDARVMVWPALAPTWKTPWREADVQEARAVELRLRGDAVDFRDELRHLELQRAAVRRGVRRVGRMHRELGILCRLSLTEARALLQSAPARSRRLRCDRLADTSHLGREATGDGEQPAAIVLGAVDPRPDDRRAIAVERSLCVRVALPCAFRDGRLELTDVDIEFGSQTPEVGASRAHNSERGDEAP